VGDDKATAGDFLAYGLIPHDLAHHEPASEHAVEEKRANQIFQTACEDRIKNRTTYQRFNNLSHPDFAGLRNAYPLAGPLYDSDVATEDGKTAVLEVIHPTDGIPGTPEPREDDPLAYGDWNPGPQEEW
jgi:hypothetical protein